MTLKLKENKNWPRFVDNDKTQDLFSQGKDYEFAGTHLLLDCWNAKNLDDLNHIEQALRTAVEISGATLLHIHLHHFTPNGGVSGVAVLAESHISIHTWPEREYAALDIFMCGDTHPHKTISVFEQAFETTDIEVNENLRGKIMHKKEGDH